MLSPRIRAVKHGAISGPHRQPGQGERDSCRCVCSTLRRVGVFPQRVSARCHDRAANTSVLHEADVQSRIVFLLLQAVQQL